jgi:ferredoxin-NADP reductase
MKPKDILTSPIKFIKGRFIEKYSKDSNIPKNSGKIIEKDSQKIAIYKDEKGEIHYFSPFCTHLGCIVQWNDKEKRWDCPCHGATFSKYGEVTSGPARDNLEELTKKELNNHIVKILAIDILTHDVKRFVVEKPNNYKFIPGQATEVAINTEGFKDKFKPFTFTSLNNDSYLEFIIKEYPLKSYPKHSGVTEEIHRLNLGDQFIIKEPVGTIKYKGPGVFIAGGVGITPFIAIFKQLKSKNKLGDNILFFSNKKAEDLLMEDELCEIFNKDNLVLTLTREKNKKYQHGRLSKKIFEKYVDSFDMYFYICGPSNFQKDISTILADLGTKKEKIIIEEW